MPSLHIPPMEYTALAIAIYSGRLDDAAVLILGTAANNIAAKENLPRVAPPEAQARRTARQPKRP